MEDDLLKSGFVGAFQHNWDYPFVGGDDSINAELKRNAGENAVFVPVDCFRNDAGITRKYVSVMIGNDRKSFIPSTCTEPLAALLYIDYISSPEVIRFLQTGLEGVTFVKTETGADELLPATGEWTRNSGNNLDYTITCNGLRLGAASKALTYSGTPQEIIIRAYEYSMTNIRTPALYNVGTIEAEIQVSGLEEKRNEMLIEAVIAPGDNFDAVYDRCMQEYLDMGGQRIIDERIQRLEAVYGITGIK